MELQVTSFQELKKELENTKQGVVCISKDIFLESEIRVRGVKILRSKGGILKRAKGHNGNLFRVQQATFVMEQVNIIGNKKRLKEQCGIYVGNSGMVLQKGGILAGHCNVKGGPVVQIGKGGTYEMQGGVIHNNKAYGTGDKKGVDGRGGAIYNEGKFIVTAGTLSNNQAIGININNQVYGGVGGAIFNAGNCYIQGGKIMNNRAVQGGGIFVERRARIWIKGGKIKQNGASLGRDIYSYFGAVYGEDNGKVGDVWDYEEQNDRQREKKVKNKKKEKTKENRKDQPVSKTKELIAKKEKLECIQKKTRYFFQSEVGTFTELDWRERLELNTLKVKGLSEMCSNSIGEYHISYTIDKTCWKQKVVIVKDQEQVESEGKRLKFEVPNCSEKKLVCIWRVSQEMQKRMKKFVNESSNLFTSESNQRFYEEFKSGIEGGTMGE